MEYISKVKTLDSGRVDIKTFNEKLNMKTINLVKGPNKKLYITSPSLGEFDYNNYNKDTDIKIVNVRSNRLNIPKDYLKYADIDNEVMLIKNSNNIEVWSKNKFDKYVLDKNDKGIKVSNNSNDLNQLIKIKKLDSKNRVNLSDYILDDHYLIKTSNNRLKIISGETLTLIYNELKQNNKDEIPYFKYCVTKIKPGSMGRYVIPPDFVKHANLDSKAVFIVTANNIEIWSKENFDKYILSKENKGINIKTNMDTLKKNVQRKLDYKNRLNLNIKSNENHYLVKADNNEIIILNKIQLNNLFKNVSEENIVKFKMNISKVNVDNFGRVLLPKEFLKHAEITKNDIVNITKLENEIVIDGKRK